jgi:hypothetical protein
MSEISIHATGAKYFSADGTVDGENDVVYQATL